MAIGVLQLHTYFLNKTEQEVDSMNFQGVRLSKSERMDLGYGITGIVYYVSHTQMFLLHFDRDQGGRITVQKTYWGNETPTFFRILEKEKINYMPSFDTDGFCVKAPNLGNVLFELIDDQGTPCIMASVDI